MIRSDWPYSRLQSSSERIDQCIRELETIRAEIAASKGDQLSPFSTPTAANGAGDATLVRLRRAAVELGGCAFPAMTSNVMKSRRLT